MLRTPAGSPHAVVGLQVVEGLQSHLVNGLAAVGPAFTPVEWFRDEGRHGGGVRYVAMDTPVFDRASVNVSQVHYDDDPDKRLSSASALSTILHPKHPRAPSMHMHISLTEMRDGQRTWRLMADLNPSIPDEAAARRFEQALREASGEHYEAGAAQGDRYFHIPALDRHRGIRHFYLEQFTTGSDDEDVAFAIAFGRAVADVYVSILNDALFAAPAPTAAELRQQLDYHSLYFLQVMTLDRGTTSGLLVHAQNDVGILGSLPSHVDRNLLAEWVPRLPAPQDQLLTGLLEVLPEETPTPVTQDVKPLLAAVSRRHYREHPEALKLQASGGVIPPTVANHR